jgi:hypothetical protein
MSELAFRAGKEVVLALAFLGATLSVTSVLGQTHPPEKSCRADVHAPSNLQINDCTALLDSGQQTKGLLSGMYSL